MKHLLALAFACVVVCAAAAERVVATLTDPAGDDNGSGTLVYPQRSDMQPGDLDLVTLKISRGDDGYKFEATFRNPVRHPATVSGDSGLESIASFARRGFYAFNIDLYFDLDRIQGSGNTFTLPGRRVRIDAAHAWEKAVVLTPRPETVRQQLIDGLMETEGARSEREVAAWLDQRVFFARQVRVRTRTVEFLVPASFFAGADARPDTDWSLTAFVTGAKLTIEADFKLLRSTPAVLEDMSLGVMQPTTGRPINTFGYTGARAPLPVVDVVAPDSNQSQQLADETLVGVTWGSGGALRAGGRTPTTRMALERAAVAAPVVQAPAEPPAARPAAPAPPSPAPAVTAPPVVSPSTGAATAPPTAAVAPDKPTAAAPSRASVAERLKTLKQLFDQKLIDETEYKQQRQRILNEL